MSKFCFLPKSPRRFHVLFSGAILLATALNFLATPARASLLYYEGFDYALGNLAGKNGGTGDWGGAWTGGTANQVVVPGSTTTIGSTDVTAPDPMSYSSGTVSVNGGNRLTVGDGTNTRLFDTPVTGQDIWMSFLFAGAPGGQVYMGLYSSTQTGNWLNYGLRFDNSGIKASAGASHSSEVSVSMATPSFLVFRLVWDPAAASGNGAYSGTQMFVNPTSATSPPGSPTRSVNNGAADLSPWQSFDRFHFGAQSANEQMAFDEIRISTTYASVIPEPSTYAFLALSGFALLLVRRRGQ